jgi:hypothetical protein
MMMTSMVTIFAVVMVTRCVLLVGMVVNAFIIASIKLVIY